MPWHRRAPFFERRRRIAPQGLQSVPARSVLREGLRDGSQKGSLAHRGAQGSLPAGDGVPGQESGGMPNLLSQVASGFIPGANAPPTSGDATIGREVAQRRLLADVERNGGHVIDLPTPAVESLDAFVKCVELGLRPVARQIVKPIGPRRIRRRR